MGHFELRALYIIVPFSVALLLGCLFVCKHKIFLWSLKRDDPEEPTAPKLVVTNVKKMNLDVEKYEIPSDSEMGNRGANESESDSILELAKGRKSFCA